ncbi:hypothetical protein PAPYR_9422 [Paratrimastix pyriformis]|uniref:Uncharacterized protein n=1 Tax=Paratrimastix pyriformis TaxID=342808 RepID=A0ABQ8U8C4_9EUKA|nr:hypothetical protein PAPYR_9422 [Paratrimastix pyriformis]
MAQNDYRNDVWHKTTGCFMYNQADCHEGRLIDWPKNSTLTMLMNAIKRHQTTMNTAFNNLAQAVRHLRPFLCLDLSFPGPVATCFILIHHSVSIKRHQTTMNTAFNNLAQAVRHLRPFLYTDSLLRILSTEDNDLTPSNPDFQMATAAFMWDLVDGTDRHSFILRKIYKDELTVAQNILFVFFPICAVTLMVSYFFFFRVNLVKGEMLKTGMMRALLPQAAFGDLLYHPPTQSFLFNPAPPPTAHLPPPQEIFGLLETILSLLHQSFEAEGRYMKRFKAPKRKRHRLDHARVLGKYQEVMEMMIRRRPDAVTALGQAIQDRTFSKHSAQFDPPLGRFLNRHGVY